MEGLLRCSANNVPLSPISFLERAASVYRDQISIVYGSVKYTWKETFQRCIQLASALTQMGISHGDVVAAMAPNVPALYELHFGVPMAGAILCPLNIRYDSSMLSLLLQRSQAKVIFVDYEFLEGAREALELLSQTKSSPPLLILIPESDTSSNFSTTQTAENIEYENLLDKGEANFEIKLPEDEFQPISVSYTSGTTSTPKGVVYSHRGAYLNSLATILLNEMPLMPVYLWTVPMFHCNGWCLPWGIAAQGGKNICIRDVTSKVIYNSISLHKVTHMGGAPTILNMIVNTPAEDQKPLPCKTRVMTGGAPPPPQIVFKMEELGFDLIHCYGMSETYGAAGLCTWKPEWDLLPADERAKMKARQGLHHLAMAEIDIKDPITMKSVPADGKTIGEVMLRGNTVMSGYWKDAKASEKAFTGGWFHAGDLAVKHADGYIEMKDRSQDIIISGGENISSIEVESVLFSHPAVLEAAVVRKPDEHGEETVCAFVKLKEGHHASAEDLIEFCRARLPHYMAPRSVIFEDLPKTSTGKTQKFILREKAKALGSLTN